MWFFLYEKIGNGHVCFLKRISGEFYNAKKRKNLFHQSFRQIRIVFFFFESMFYHFYLVLSSGVFRGTSCHSTKIFSIWPWRIGETRTLNGRTDRWKFCLQRPSVKRNCWLPVATLPVTTRPERANWPFGLSPTAKLTLGNETSLFFRDWSLKII